MTAIHLTVHENAADFLTAASAFLNLSEAENSIVSISAARMVSGPTGDDADAYLATVEHEGAVVAAALHGSSGSVMLTGGSAPDGVVSLAGYGDGGTDVARIAPVFTPPGYRRRNYASALVGELSRELFEQGKRAMFLTTDVANPTSNSIYRKIGYLPAADHYHFDFLPPPA